MTTIATDGKTIVADGRRTAENEIIAGDVQKIAVGAGCVYALCGDGAMFEAVVEWFEKGANPADMPPAKEPSWDLLVIRQSGPVLISSSMPYARPQVYPFAMGSGERWALGAMKAGSSPRRAVEIAVECDVLTGGRLVEIDLATALDAVPQRLPTDVLEEPAVLAPDGRVVKGRGGRGGAPGDFPTVTVPDNLLLTVNVQRD